MNREILLIAEDDMTAQVGSFILRSVGLQVLTAGSRHQALELIHDKSFDQFIIYASECKKEWIDLCRELRLEHSNPILCVMPADTQACVLEAYKQGVDEFIPLPISPELFVAKVRAWLRRSWNVPALELEALQMKGIVLDPVRRGLILPGRELIRLTNLEFRVVYLLMRYAERPLTTQFIIERVWLNEEGDAASLKNIIYRLRHKLEAIPGKPNLLQTLPHEGYIFRPP